MDDDERHEPEMWVCPACGESIPEEEDSGTLMNLGGVNSDEQPTWCEGCAGECGWMVEGYGVL